MSLSVYFDKKCVDATVENITTVLKKLAEPMDLVSFDISGSLVDAVGQGMGGLANFASDYVKNNADAIAYSMINVASQNSGKFGNLRDGLNTAFNILSLAQLGNNTFALYLMKFIARNCIKKIQDKDIIVDKVLDGLTQLYNALKVLTGGDPAYKKYLENLRSAYQDLISARNNLRNVKSTIEARGIYLSKTYEKAQNYVLSAQHKLRPSTGGNPYTTDSFTKSGQALLTTMTGLPTSEQFDAMMSIPRICAELVTNMKDYAATLVIINGLLVAYQGGPDLFIDSIGNRLTKYVTDFLAVLISELNTLTTEIDENLKARNGSPNPTQVTSMAFQWTAQVSMILGQMKVLPADALKNLSLANADVEFFNSTVNALKNMDTVRSGNAILIATDAQEQIGSFEQQMLTAILGATKAIGSGTATTQLFSLIQTLRNRMSLTKGRDLEIKSVLQSFVDRPISGEEQFEKVLNGVRDLLGKVGLDRAAELLEKGDFAGFFGLDGKNATYVGAALTAVAFLKECFETDEQREEMTKIQRSLERDMDLLTLKVGFDFDLAVFKNIQLCLEVEGLSSVFNAKEFLCGLAKEGASIFSSIGNLLKLGSGSGGGTPQVSRSFAYKQL